jgi:hypothetical protein
VCPSKVVVDSLDGLPMGWPGACCEVGNGHNSKHDVGACGQCHLVEHANGLTVTAEAVSP